MEETFLCFEAEATLFLMPLPLVRHIVAGEKRRNGQIIYDGNEVRTVGFARLWDRQAREDGEYAVLVQGSPELWGLSVQAVSGVYEIDAQKQCEIPAAAKGKDNAFLARAVFIEDLDRWAFTVDENIITAIEGLWHDTEGERQAGCIDENLEQPGGR